MYRFRGFQTSDEQLEPTLDARFENLSFEDSDLLDSFTKQSKQSLISSNNHLQTNGVNGETQVARRTGPPPSTDKKLAHMAQFLSRTWMPQAYSTQQATFSGLALPSQFLTYHPLSNELVLHRDGSSSSQGLWLASMYELMLDVYNMQLALTSLPSARLERRKEKQKLPAFLHSYYEALRIVIGGMWIARRNGEHVDGSCLKSLRTLFWAFFALAEGPGFDRATFQTYLKMLSSSMPVVSGQTPPLLQDMHTALSKQIAVFGSDVHLTSGLAMERIWRAFKPTTPKSHGWTL
jgi:midasin